MRNDTTPPSRPGTFAGRLNYLFETDPRRPTNDEVAKACAISGSYIGYLRKGERDNPTILTVQKLATYFGVPVTYLAELDLPAERAEEIEAQLRLRQALTDPRVKNIALRAAEGLSPAGLDMISAMIEHIHRLERSSRPRARTEPSADR